jgi:hypothetical protein
MVKNRLMSVKACAGTENGRWSFDRARFQFRTLGSARSALKIIHWMIFRARLTPSSNPRTL